MAESLHFTNGRELKVLDRGKTYRYKGQSLYGADAVYLPISKITAVNWQADSKNTAVTHLVIQTSGQDISFPLLTGNPSIPYYTRYLSQLTNAPIVPAINAQGP